MICGNPVDSAKVKAFGDLVFPPGERCLVALLTSFSLIRLLRASVAANMIYIDYYLPPTTMSCDPSK